MSAVSDLTLIAGALIEVLGAHAFVDGDAGVRPEAAQVHAASERNRLGGAKFLVARLTAVDGLRPGLTTDRAAAAALVLMDPAIHRTLVSEHGWTRAEYADWIGRAAVAELLEGGDAEGV